MNTSGGAGDDREPERQSPEPVDPWAPPTGVGDPVSSGSAFPAPRPPYPHPSGAAYTPPPGAAYPGASGPAYPSPAYPGSAYPTPGYGPDGYGGYGAQPGYYPGPDDPLVSANFGDWWARSFRLLTTTWRPILMVELWWVIPILVVTIAGALITNDAVVGSNPDATDALAALAIGLPATLISLLMSAVLQLAALHVVVQRATGQQVSVRAALLAGLRRVHAIIGWGVAAMFLIGGGVVLCVLPGIYVALVLITLPAIVLLERNKGIGRAFELFHAKVGDSLARVATIIAIAFIVGVVGNAFNGLLGNGTAFSEQASPTVAAAVLGAILSTVLSLAGTIVLTPMMLTAYADMRARREPFSTAYLMPPQPTSAYAESGYQPPAT